MYTEEEINSTVMFLTDLSTYLHSKGQLCSGEDFRYYFSKTKVIKDTIAIINRYKQGMISLSEDPVTKEGE